MKTILVCAACFGAVASSAFAEEELRPDGKTSERETRFDRGSGGLEKDGKHRRPPFNERSDMFKRMDLDGDGMITRTEFFSSPRLSRLPEEKRNEIFARLDGDRDGSLSKKEIHEIRKGGDERAREFSELDADGSGGLNFAEFSEGKFFKKLPEGKRQEIFGRLDTDGDGEVSPRDRPREQRQKPYRQERPQKKGNRPE